MAHYEPSIGKSDEWYTPKYVFDALDVNFDLDVSAPTDLFWVNTPTNTFIYENSLSEVWNGFVWMNPPFGGRNGLVPWLTKFFDHGNGVALTPDRSSAPWWQDSAKNADAILQVKGRMRFYNSEGKNSGNPTNGVTLFASGERGVAALLNANRNGLGIAFKKLI